MSSGDTHSAGTKVPAAQGIVLDKHPPKSEKAAKVREGAGAQRLGRVTTRKGAAPEPGIHSWTDRGLGGRVAAWNSPARRGRR